MNIRQLESFVRVVEAGSFQKAADELFITQPTLSKQMQSLEKELQITLFDRSRRSAKLTEAGQKLYQKAPDFLAHYHRLIGAVSAAGQPLNIAVVPIWEYYGLTHCVMDFMAKFPQIELKMHENQNAAIPNLIHSGACTLGLFRVVEPDKDNWNYITLFRDELVLVVPPSFPYASGQRVSLKEFEKEQFVLLGKDTQLYTSSVNACQKAGFSPKIIYQGSSAETIHQIVAQGKGVAIFMKQVALQQTHTNNTILHFDETVQSQIILAYSKNHILNEGGRLFWRYMKDYAAL